MAIEEQKYSSYKHSGFEWIGYIPEHWKVKKLKYMPSERPLSFIDGDWIESKDIVFEEGIRYITTGNIGEGKYKEQGHSFITQETFDALNCTEVFPGDLLISRLNNPIGRSCIMPDLGRRVVTSVDNVIFRPRKDYDKEYLNFLMNNSKYYEYTWLIARGATMQRISRGLLAEIKLCAPPIEEQKVIAHFLSGKTAEIDTAIADKELLIALYEAEVKALINAAVTKGLNSNAPLKPSGIDWLADVPKHWEVKKLKYWLNLITIKSEVQSKKVGLENIESGTGRFINTDSEFEGDGVEFKADDILFGKLRPYLAKVYLAGFAGSAVGDFFVFRCKEGMVYPAFAAMRMLDYSFIDITNSCAYGAKMPRVGSDFISNLLIAFPPISEQQEIVGFIQSATEEINPKIALIRKEITLLKEYKQALIFEAVTGKIKIDA